MMTTLGWQLGGQSGARKRSRTAKWKPETERLEQRLALAADLAVLSSTTLDSRSVEVSYRVDGDGGLPFDLAIYRSADANFDPSDVKLASQTITDAGGTPPVTQTVNVVVPGGLGIDPAHPFIMAVADPGGQVSETDEANNVASFRKYVIGAISHGTDAAPAWEPVMAASLTALGYDRVVPFVWAAESVVPVPGQAVAAGQRMAAQIIAAAQTLPEGSVIDLHLIGHSRGSVVISQATQTIQILAESGADPQLKGVLAGWTKLTYLDPHPAHNVHTTSAGTTRFFSASPGPIGRLATQLTLRFQAAMQDPEPVVPSSADQAEVFFQHAPYYAAPDPIDRLFNIWGEVPLTGATRYIDLTGIANGHYVMPYWYQTHVVPTLRTGGDFTVPEPTATPARPRRNPRMYERGILFPSLVDRPGVASGLLTRASSTAAALERGNIVLANRRYANLVRFALQRRDRISPELLSAVTSIQPLLGQLR